MVQLAGCGRGGPGSSTAEWLHVTAALEGGGGPAWMLHAVVDDVVVTLKGGGWPVVRLHEGMGDAAAARCDGPDT